MKKNREFIKFFSLGLGLILIAYFFPQVIPNKIASSINDLFSSYTYFFSQKSLKPLKLVAIAIDEDSLNQIPQRWPWKRSVYAKAIKILDKEGVKTIGLDLALVGEAEDKDDDHILSEVLKNVSSCVVLGYFLDYKNQTAVLPFTEFRESACALGLVSTPQDADGKIRRLLGDIELADKKTHYSFTVALAASFLNQTPDKIISQLPLLKDSTFFINYLLKPKDILTLSFFDLLENLAGLKQRYGKDFLRGTLVMIYPEAEIFHDRYLTSLGKMPGGILQLNGVANIISGRLLREVKPLSALFLALCLLFIFYLLRYFGFIVGLFFTLGIFVFDFWIRVFLNLGGISFDYARVVSFGLLFFLGGSLYKYLSFLTQLLKIKHKATLDPLRNLFTLRYFYFRLELERKNFYFRKDLFLIFLYLESAKETIEALPLERQRLIWQEIGRTLVSLKDKSFWSVYSDEELVGGIVSRPSGMERVMHFLRNNLGALLSEREIKGRVKLGYCRFKKEFSIRELLFVLSNELKRKKEDLAFFKDSDLAKVFSPVYARLKQTSRFIESLDEDIEERNRQLLSLLDNLQKEHLKTKEAFFQIITSLVNALEARDPYTQGHSERVCNYALAMAQKIGWTKEQKEDLKKAALLHDLGKIGIPDIILHKKGRLTSEEWDFIKKHELLSVKILEPLTEINKILPWIMYHHERWDGKGYPHGLAGEAIPEAAQVIALADVFDALTTGRDYKVAFSPQEAIREIVRGKGTQFNPRLVDIFVETIASLPVRDKAP